MPKPVHTRDHRIDLLRGIALVMIFINHVPETLWEHFTSRNFGFSDAAEGFVLMSGMAAGLAYGPAYLLGKPTPAILLRPWKRAGMLWLVHCGIILSVLAMFIAMFDHPAIQTMAYGRNILRAIEDPAGMLLPLISLGHQFAYADILPLYVVLMLASPALLFLCARWPRATMSGAVMLWLVIGLSQLKMPTWPTDYGWSFNPMAWQVLFVAGILTGFALRQGKRFLPVTRWGMWLALGFLAVSTAWVRVPVIAEWGGHGLWLLNKYAGVPALFTSFDKTFLFLPRLLHILALAYVLSILPVVKLLAAQAWLAPVVLLGRHSLPVFATGSVLAYVGQVIKAVTPNSFLMDTVLIATGLGIMFAVGYLRDASQKRAHARRIDAAPTSSTTSMARA